VTSTFGVSRRESHDSSGFYARFSAPQLDLDASPADPSTQRALDELFCGDARSMGAVPSDSVALVVTSPPYFAGKDYESELGAGPVPGSYVEYLEMLTDVFGECVRTLEPGGRIAVNVANLGRRPFRSLAADVTAILQDRLRLLLRGEVVWLKQRGSAGSCAWGSFQRPGNPVLRDTTERIIIASKGRFDRAVNVADRRRIGLPWASTLQRDEFMDATLDVWEFPPESATRVGHPAPFPVALPERLIGLYTYLGDLVLDPFVGAGTTAVAALRTGRHYVGYDTEADYLAVAAERVAAERAALTGRPAPGPIEVRSDGGPLALSDARARGCSARECAAVVVRSAVAGFGGDPGEVLTDVAVGAGLSVDVAFTDRNGPWHVLVCGGYSATRPGLRRSDGVLRALGTASALRSLDDSARVVLLAPGLPGPSTSRGSMLSAAVRSGTVTAVVDLDEDPVGSFEQLLGAQSPQTGAIGVSASRRRR